MLLGFAFGIRGAPRFLWQEISQLSAKFLEENCEAQNWQNFYAILFNPWNSSVVAMAMSIYRTLCVLVCTLVTLEKNLDLRSFLFGNIDPAAASLFHDI